MGNINYQTVEEHKRAKKNVWKISISCYSLRLRLSAILNTQMQPVPETRLSGLAMTSVLCHWLRAKPFVFFAL